MYVVQTDDSTPPYRSFQNGQRVTDDGVTITNPPPNAQVQGSGFSIIPDYNNVFYSQCTYQANGTYTQRHYVTSAADVFQTDYSNYRDVRVTVNSQTVTGAGVIDENDVIEGGLNSLLASAGITSTGGKLMAWIIITLFIAGVLFMIHWMLGIGGFVLLMIGGVVISLVPIWVVLIFVIICAAIAGVAYRSMVAGS
jgi:hypothetical protein